MGDFAIFMVWISCFGVWMNLCLVYLSLRSGILNLPFLEFGVFVVLVFWFLRCDIWFAVRREFGCFWFV